MAQVNAGRVRFVSRGEYSNTTQYYLFDLVNYEGSSYVAIGNTLGNLPTNTTYWQLVAEKGNTGSVGPEGPQGVGIASITKTSTEGLVDTYTITYTDGTTTTFQVTNGEDGDVTPTEFNALKQDVEDLRDNQIIYPSLDQPALEGTNINITDAAKARVYNLELEKESSQHTTRGVQLFDKDNPQALNAQITTSGSIGFSTNGRCIYIPIKENTSYTITKILSSKLRAGTTIDVPYPGVTLNNFVNNDNLTEINITSSAEDKYLLVYYYLNGTDTLTQEEVLDSIQIEEGSTATEYEEYTGGQPSPNPDYPQEVKTVKGYRNLLVPYGNVVRNGVEVTSTDTKLIINGTPTSAYLNVNSSNHTTLKAGTYKIMTQYVSGSITGNCQLILINNANGNSIVDRIYSTSNYQDNFSQTIVLTQETEFYIRIYCANTDRTYNNFTFNIQIVEGNQQLPYVPYGNNYVNVAVSDGTNTNNYPIPLNNNEIVGIGDYKDELLVDKSGHVFINKKTFDLTLNGSENIYLVNSGTENYYYRIPFSSNRAVDYDNNLCTHYKRERITNTNTIQGFRNFETEIRIRYGAEQTIEDYKLWLSNNPVRFYLARETPDLIDLNTTVDIRLFKGVNNISNSEDGNMRIRYVESIESLVARVVALEEAQS